MIITSIQFSVAGNNYEELLQKTKNFLSEFFDIPTQDVEKKTNIEISIKDQTDSIEFDEEDYVATVIAQVKNV